MSPKSPFSVLLRGPPSTPWSHLQAGFTLVELLVTIAILGITATAVAPAINSWYNDRDANSPPAITERLFRLVRAEAIAEAHPMELRLDPTTGRYRISGDTLPITGLLPGGSIYRAADGAERPRWLFTSDGRVTGPALAIYGSAPATLRFDPGTGEPSR